ncbi:hypothetical protein BKA80DRAFT_255150 [Phyllosticta citrichinensis]
MGPTALGRLLLLPHDPARGDAGGLAGIISVLGQGWRPAERLNRAVNELAAAAPTPDTCPLLLNDLDTEVASAFTFNSEPVEEQTTSINDVLNILCTNIQCIALAWEVQGNLRWI